MDTRVPELISQGVFRHRRGTEGGAWLKIRDQTSGFPEFVFFGLPWLNPLCLGLLLHKTGTQHSALLVFKAEQTQRGCERAWKGLFC